MYILRRKLASYESLVVELEGNKRKKRKLEIQKAKAEELKNDPKKQIDQTHWVRKGIIVKILHKKLNNGISHVEKNGITTRDSGTYTMVNTNVSKQNHLFIK